MLQVWAFFQCWDWLNFFFLFKPCYGYKLHEWEYGDLFVQHNQIIILVFTWKYDVSSCNRTTKNNSVLTNTIGLINKKGDFHLLTKITFFVVVVKRNGKIIRYLYRQDLSQPIFPWRFSNRVKNGEQANTNWQDVQEILPCRRLQYLSHVGRQGVQTGEIRTKQKGYSLNTLPNMNRSFVPVLQNLSCESGLWIFGFERMKRWWRKESKCVKMTKMAWPFLETLLSCWLLVRCSKPILTEDHDTKDPRMTSQRVPENQFLGSKLSKRTIPSIKIWLDYQILIRCFRLGASLTERS